MTHAKRPGPGQRDPSGLGGVRNLRRRPRLLARADRFGDRKPEGGHASRSSPAVLTVETLSESQVLLARNFVPDQGSASAHRAAGRGGPVLGLDASGGLRLHGSVLRFRGISRACQFLRPCTFHCTFIELALHFHCTFIALTLNIKHRDHRLLNHPHRNRCPRCRLVFTILLVLYGLSFTGFVSSKALLGIFIDGLALTTLSTLISTLGSRSTSSTPYPHLRRDGPGSFALFSSFRFLLFWSFWPFPFDF